MTSIRAYALALAASLATLLASAGARAELAVPITYLRVETDAPPTLSNLDPIPERLGIDGAELGLADNLTTGRFLGHLYTLEILSVPPGADPLTSARGIGTDLVVLDAPAETLLAIADLPEMAGKLLFNASAEDIALRDAACRANLLHTVPSLAMRADALMQFFVKRRWRDLVMIRGGYPADLAFAAALERSAIKFGLEIRDIRDWVFDADMRRNAAQEVPLFTQGFGDYDALLVADETGDFGRYILYNTWEPRPVAGSEGLSPKTWDRVVEQWGAAQLQSRFDDQSQRPMQSRDYAAWAAIRAIGEAVTRTGAGDAATLRAFLLGPDFELAGFKGRPLTFRDWNGQLRQPIGLMQPRALVASAPLEGFLHQRTELDTLGLDRPESACTAFD